MSTVIEIKEAIAHLSPQEFCELMAELQPFAADEWDLQIEADIRAGRFDAAGERARADYEAGRCAPL